MIMKSDIYSLALTRLAEKQVSPLAGIICFFNVAPHRAAHHGWILLRKRDTRFQVTMHNNGFRMFDAKRQSVHPGDRPPDIHFQIADG